jgi:hypothetical protein
MTRRMSRNGEPGRNRPRQGEAEGRSRVADFSGRAMTRRMSRNGEPGRNRTFNQQIKSRWESQGTSSQVVILRTNLILFVAADDAQYGRSATRCHTAGATSIAGAAAPPATASSRSVTSVDREDSGEGRTEWLPLSVLACAQGVGPIIGSGLDEAKYMGEVRPQESSSLGDRQFPDTREILFDQSNIPWLCRLSRDLNVWPIRFS